MLPEEKPIQESVFAGGMLLSKQQLRKESFEPRMKKDSRKCLNEEFSEPRTQASCFNF